MHSCSQSRGPWREFEMLCSCSMGSKGAQARPRPLSFRYTKVNAHGCVISMRRCSSLKANQNTDAQTTQDSLNSVGIVLSLHEALTLVRAVGHPEEGVVSIIRLIQALMGPQQSLEAQAPFSKGGLVDEEARRAWQHPLEPAGAQFFPKGREPPDVYLSDQLQPRRGDQGSGPSVKEQLPRGSSNMEQGGEHRQEQQPALYRPDTTMRSSVGRVAGPLVGVQQPGSLWQTTNRAIGGIHR